ncbi:MAG: transcriptional regulator [Microvirga sp.]|jgi:DNA-binding GntR family transcriptional regulator|nr:transcriptional regulator [Microvirga sp.]
MKVNVVTDGGNDALTTPDKRLALHAYEQILELILSGQVAGGTLVNERRLATLLNMSRTPVRDALLMLEGEGLLLRQGSRGLQIRQMRVEDFMDALQIRQLLEPEVARMAAGRVPAEELRTLAAELQAIIDGGSADREVVRGVDERLHGLIADAASNTQLSAIIRTLRRQTQMFDLRSVPERRVDTCHEHLDIIEAIEKGDGARAAAAMERHLAAVRHSIIKRLTGG